MEIIFIQLSGGVFFSLMVQGHIYTSLEALSFNDSEFLMFTKTAFIYSKNSNIVILFMVWNYFPL